METKNTSARLRMGAFYALLFVSLLLALSQISTNVQAGTIPVTLQGISLKEPAAPRIPIVLGDVSATLRPTRTPTPGVLPTKTATPKASPTLTSSASVTTRPTRTSIAATATMTSTPTKTSTWSPTASKTPTPTSTPTATTPSSTVTATKTPTRTSTPTATKTLTPTSTSTSTPTPTQPGPLITPVAYWKFDESGGTLAADSSGNGYAGTLVNGPVWTSGKIDGALSFDGINDYVTTVDDPLDITGSLTVTGWVYQTGNSVAEHIISKDQSSTGCPLQLAILTTGKLRSFTRGNGLNQTIDSNNTLSLNAWHHVALVRDAATSKVTFYIDGSQDSGGWKAYSPDRVAASAATAKIGARGDATANFFKGNLDDLRIYARPLSAAEIQALYQAGGGDGNPPSVAITSPVNGTSVHGTIAVQVSASAETGIDQVEVFKDGASLGKDPLLPYTFVWSTALEPNGNHTLTAVATDSSGNQATSAPVSVTINNPAVSQKPNIVVIVTDDQRWDTTGPEYMPVANSVLYPESIRFTNTIAAVPLCCPSRASIFTGLYSYHHGVIDNQGDYGAPKFNDTSTIATWLDGAGYRTGLFGKYMNLYNKIAPKTPPGWDEWHAFLEDNGNYKGYTLVENGALVSYSDDMSNYSTEVLTDKAIQFINTTDPATPVFVYLAVFAPHFNLGGGDMSSPPIPALVDDGAFAGLLPWRPPSYNEANVSDKPLWIQQLPLMSSSVMATGDLFRIKQLESMLAVDRAIGELINTLKQTGRYNNTIFAFLSDNGLSWGEHRWNWRKWCAYEECVRIPFWIRIPGTTGRNDDALVNDVDLAPTLAELAGVRPPNDVDGLSLVDLVKTPLAPWRTEAYTEYLGSYKPTGRSIVFREVRTDSYMYSEYDTGEREFYDLVLDPFQLLNRVNDPIYTQTVNDLQKLLQILRNQ